MSLIDRSLFSPNLVQDEDENYNNLLREHKKYEAGLESSLPQDVNNINEIRKLIREQSFLGSNSNRVHQTSESSEELEVPARRFQPLPDIPRFDDPYYRTESRLIKQEIENDTIYNDDSSLSLNTNEPHINNKRPLVQNESKYAYLFDADNLYNDLVRSKNNPIQLNKSDSNKINHFASSNKKTSHRLPALEKNIVHTLQNTMDLDEDLPMNPVHDTNRREVYTSPGERLISPIKRPQAPSPAASAYRRKSKPKTDSDTEN